MVASLLLSVFAGCSEELPDDGGKTIGNIEVSYACDGVEVKSLPFNSSSRSVSVDVTVNNQDIYWNMESDAAWCKVVDERHRGDGSFTLNILANDEYDDREPANLTFVSGQYRGSVLQVSQTGNVFIVNKLFSVSSRDGGTEELEVSVKDGVEWDIVGGEWLTAKKETGAVSENGVVKTTVTVSWDANSASSRFGSIGLKRSDLSDADAHFSVFQFGNEVPCAEDGTIMLPARDCPAVEVKVPSASVSDIVLPEWVTYTATDNADNTVTYSLMFSDNPSDTRTVRESEIVFDVADKDSDVTLPVMKQAYYTVDGITTADGLSLFARTLNSGGDISEWQKDGKVTLLNNIDMSALSGEWVPAGTAEHPFDGVFDGRYRKIMNMKASEPLFGVCKGASISNIIIDPSSEFKSGAEYMTEFVLAPLAGDLTDCTVSECTNNAPVTVSASTLNESTSAFVGGLVGRTYGNTVITNSVNYGNVAVTDACKTAKTQGKFYVGGIVAQNGGTIDQCTNNGAVSDAAVSYFHYLSGVAGLNQGTVKASKNCGKVSIAAVREVDGQNDVSRYIYMGGVVGDNAEEGQISGSVNDAALVSSSDVKIQRIGGIAGCLEGAQVSENTNTENGKIDINGASTANRGVRQLSLGGLYGEISCDATLNLVGSVSAGALNVSDYEYSITNTFVFVGGLIGRVPTTYSLSLSKPEWKSTISFNFKNDKFAAYVLGIGGIVGCAGTFELNNTTAVVKGGLLTVEDATVGGFIDIQANSSNAVTNKYAGIGGVAGFVSIGGVTFHRCTSETKIMQPDFCARSNGSAQHIGGIVGVVLGGKSEISDCHNTGEIDNEHYNNNAWNISGQQCGSAAGIIGAYAYNNDYDASIKISGCTNTASVRSYRGMAGGIAGYLRNAEVSSCNNTGTMANGSRSYVGGVVGIVDNTALTGCTAVCKVGGSSAGSEIFSGGGVVGILWKGSSCKDCSFFGDITSLTTKTGETAGSVAGSTAAGSSVSGCKFGGSVLGSAVTASNYSSFVAGDANASVSSCSYWNGK